MPKITPPSASPARSISLGGVSAPLQQHAASTIQQLWHRKRASQHGLAEQAWRTAEGRLLESAERAAARTNGRRGKIRTVFAGMVRGKADKAGARKQRAAAKVRRAEQAEAEKRREGTTKAAAARASDAHPVRLQVYLPLTPFYY